MDIARRRFIIALAVSLVPRRAGAQPPAQPAGVHRVGFLSATPVPDLVDTLRQGLREQGLIEGRNLILEYRSADGRFDRIPGLATELRQRNAAVLVISGTALPYVDHAAGNVPVVFVIADDPVTAGFVSSLGRPGGRMTGLTSLNIDLDGKRLEILKTALPHVTRVGVVNSPRDPARSDRLTATDRAARAVGVHTTPVDVAGLDTVPAAFDAAARMRIGALMVLGSPLFRAWQPQMADAARRRRLPIVSAWRELPVAGGLMSYGANVPAMFRRAATYVDRILKGANPAELPVEQATKFDLVVNAKSAATLGVTIPASILLRADQVIE